jgi:hypothetical protein
VFVYTGLLYMASISRCESKHNSVQVGGTGFQASIDITLNSGRGVCVAAALVVSHAVSRAAAVSAALHSRGIKAGVHGILAFM